MAKRYFKTIKMTSYAGAILPAMVSAATITEAPETGGVRGLLSAFAGKLLLFTSSLAMLFIVIGGVMYITSAGNPDGTEKAKKTITYAIIGLLLVIFSYFVINLLQGGFRESIVPGQNLQF